MEKNTEKLQEMNEARNPQRTFEQACRGLKTHTLDAFGNECIRRLEKRLTENGNH